MTLRFDSWRLDATKIETLPSGGIRVPAALSRVGVLTYHQAGKVVKEYRPEEEVMREDSLASLRDAPVTEGHPREGLVSAANRERLAVGHVSGTPRFENGHIVADIVITRQDTVRKVLARELVDLSPGYKLGRVDETPGEYNGERYDRVQRDIMYNHNAILPPAGGRQGRTVSLRLDGNGDQLFEVEEEPMKIKIRLDGKEHEVEAGSQEHFDLEARKDARLEELEASLAVVEAERDSARQDAVDAVALLKKAPVEAEARVKARLTLENAAQKVLGDTVKLDSKTDREIRELVIAKQAPEFKLDGKDDAYINAMFDIQIVKPQGDLARRDSVLSNLGAAGGNGGGSGDEGDKSKSVRFDENDPDPELAAAHARKASQSLYTRPMQFTSKV